MNRQTKAEAAAIERELIEQSHRIVFGKVVRTAVNPKRKYADK